MPKDALCKGRSSNAMRDIKGNFNPPSNTKLQTLPYS